MNTTNVSSVEGRKQLGTVSSATERAKQRLSNILSTDKESVQSKLIELFGRHETIANVCAELGVARPTLLKWMELLGVDRSHLKPRDASGQRKDSSLISFSREQFEAAVQSSNDWCTVAKKLGYSLTNQMRLKRRADAWSVDYTHFSRLATANRILDGMTTEQIVATAAKSHDWRSFLEACGCPLKHGSVRIAKSKLAQMGISTTHFTRAEWTHEQFMEAVKNARNYRQVILNLGLKGFGNYRTVYSYIERNNIDVSHFDSLRPNWSHEEFLRAVKNSHSLSEVRRNLGQSAAGSFASIKKYITRYGIDVSHFTSKFDLS